MFKKVGTLKDDHEYTTHTDWLTLHCIYVRSVFL